MIERIKEEYPDVEFLTADGYEDCIIGVCTRFGQEPIIAYDSEKVIKSLMRDGINQDDAIEFFEYNIIGAWMGDNTPCFLDVMSS